jgi:hypothetical protein
MNTDLTTRLSALLSQEEYRADRALDRALQEIWSDLASKGAYHGSSNVFMTKLCYEEDIESRFSTLLATIARVLATASPREVQDSKASLDGLAHEWLGKHIDAIQGRFSQHAANLGMSGSDQLDLGRERVLNALDAELALIGATSVSAIADSETFVDLVRLDELGAIAPSKFDVSRLVRLCEELNISFRYRCFHAVAFLTRAILDHIPPLFGCRSFSEVANNYSGGRSFKDLASHLENASRKVCDGLIHMPMRESESLPTLAQVDVRQQLDTILAEVVRIHRSREQS